MTSKFGWLQASATRKYSAPISSEYPATREQGDFWLDRLVFGVQEACHQLWVGGRKLANVVFANVRRGAFFHTMRSRYKWQPASKLLLSGTTIGEKKNFVWEEPGIDLP